MVAIVCMTTALCLGQNIDPKNAKILKEQRFNAGDGRTGAAFATEDGHLFREETDAQGNRIGQYSYIGDNGQVFTVKYSAGKDGFRILEGDHIRATGQDAAAFDPQAEQPIPAPIAAPIPTPIAAPIAPTFREEIQEEVDPNRNPFINPHDPTHRDFAFNKNGAEFEPKTQSAQFAQPAQLSGSLVPDCADCAGVNPFVNPFDASHGGLLAGHLAGQQAGQFVPAAPQQIPRPRQLAQPVSTPTPARFFPPGQLKLNRFENGFNFDFES